MTDMMFIRAGRTPDETAGEVVKEAGLRSDGELVQALADRFDFRAAEDAAADHDHKDWVDLLSMGGGAAASSRRETLTIVHEAIDIIHDDAPAAPDDLL